MQSRLNPPLDAPRRPAPSRLKARDGTGLRIVRQGGLRWHTQVQDIDDRLTEVLTNPERYLADEARQYKSSRVVTVVRIPALDTRPGLVLRRLNYGKLKHRLRDFLRPSRAYRALQHGILLEQIGVPTARALAAAEVRRCRWPLAAYLVTEEIPEAQTLAVYLRGAAALPRILVRQLAEAIALLHEFGFSHRDLKLTNVLIDGARRPWLIDLDGLRRYRHLPDERATADLIRFARGLVPFPAALAQSGRFLAYYCRLRGNRYQPRALTALIAASLSTPIA